MILFYYKYRKITIIKKKCESRFPYCFLTDFTKFFFEEVSYLILASTQRKLRGYVEFLKFDVTIKKKNKIQVRLKFEGLD